jgi:hypothetical protein
MCMSCAYTHTPIPSLQHVQVCPPPSHATCQGSPSFLFIVSPCFSVMRCGVRQRVAVALHAAGDVRARYKVHGARRLSFCYTSSRVSHSRPQSRSPEVKVYSRSRRGEAQGVMEASRAHLAPPRASLRTPPPPPPPPPPRIQRRSPRRLEPPRHMPGIHMDTWTSWTWTSDEYGGGVVTQGGPVGRVEAISR